MSRPSDDMTLEELREEFDWICEFQSRMAERISGNPDVHNHVDYVNQLEAENAKLRELVALMYRDMQGVLNISTDTVWVDDIGTLRDAMDYHMQAMAELGMPPTDYERRVRELGIEVDA